MSSLGKLVTLTQNRALMAFIPVFSAAVLTIFPYVVNGAPFGTDQWGPMNIAYQLSNSSALSNASSFSNPNIYWPGVSIFGLVSATILGEPIITTMPLIVPLVSSIIVILLFFLIVESLTGSTIISSIASILLTTSEIFTVSMGSATKQTFAMVFFFLAILLLIKKVDLKSITVFGIVALAMIVSHHATSFLFLAISVGILVIEMILSLTTQSLSYSKVSIPILLGAMLGGYFYLYAEPGWIAQDILINTSQILLALSFVILSLFIVGCHMLARRSSLLKIVAFGGLIISFGIFSIVTTTIQFAPPFISNSLLYTLFLVPYLVVGVLATIGYHVMRASSKRKEFAFVGSWLALMLGLEAFVVFGGLGGVIFVARLLVFVYPPVTILASVAIAKYATGNNNGLSRKILAMSLTTLVIFLSVFQSYSAIVGNENVLGAQWNFKPSDIAGASYSKFHLPSNVTLAGDYREVSLFFGYYGINMTGSSSLAAYAYLSGSNQGLKPQLLVTYKLMQLDGFVIIAYGWSLPSNWTSVLTNNSSLVYNNGNTMLWK